MRSPKVGKQRSAIRPLSLARGLPKLSLPPSAVNAGPSRPRPQVGKPAQRGPVKSGRNG